MADQGSTLRAMTVAQALDAMSRDELLGLLNVYTRLMLTVDGLWFLGVERALGHDAAVRMDEEVWRDFGRNAGQRLRKLLGAPVDPREFLRMAGLLGPMVICMGARAEIDDGGCTVTVTECHPQIARERKGMGAFACKPVGTAYFEGLTAGLDPGLRVTTVFCPPDRREHGAWCRWRLTLDPSTGAGTRPR